MLEGVSNKQALFREQIVFAYGATNTAPAALRTMDREGINVQSLGVNGRWPQWRRIANNSVKFDA